MLLPQKALLQELLSRLLPESDPSQPSEETHPGAQGTPQAHPPQTTGAVHAARASSDGEEKGGAVGGGRKVWRADEFVAKGVARIRAHVLFEDAELHRSLQFIEMVRVQCTRCSAL